VDKDRNVHPTVFDIPIEIEDPHKTKMHAAVQSLEAGSTLEGIMAAEDEVAALAHQIRTGREKRDFLNGFAQDPAGFINRWMASQARDLDIVLGNEIGLPGTNGGLVREEDLRRSDLFRMPWVSLGSRSSMRDKPISDSLSSGLRSKKLL
jgi:SWI/SNF-related matrix-associated actin-dependent regulator of chromatin subfamily D